MKSEKELSLEKQIQWIFSCQEGLDDKISIQKDCSDEYNNLDFLLKINKIDKIWLECKERKQLYNNEWSQISGIERENLFAIDETSIKTLFDKFPNFILLLFDKVTNKYFIFCPINLLTISKVRINRPINKIVSKFKGKWLININDGIEFDDIVDVIKYIYFYRSNYQKDILIQTECYNLNDDVNQLSKERTRESFRWNQDVEAK